MKFFREFEFLFAAVVSAVVRNGRFAGCNRFLRVAETAKAQVAEQPTLHHDKAEPVRDRSHEGVPLAETHAVVHQTVRGRVAAQRHVAEVVQQVDRLRNGHDQTEQPQPGERAHEDQPHRLGAGQIFLTRKVFFSSVNFFESVPSVATSACRTKLVITFFTIKVFRKNSNVRRHH